VTEATELFESSVRAAGDLAGVFEYEDNTGYFYLCAITGTAGEKVVDAIQVLRGDWRLETNDIAVRWDARTEKVGLFLKGVLCAAFDVLQQRKYGGVFQPDSSPSLPDAVVRAFDAGP
jgi:hypothetical protein